MTTLPFSLNIFRQLEIFQDIKQLDKQFESMLDGWKILGYKQETLPSISVHINYPTWEIEKKILLWHSRENRHLGSPFPKSYFNLENIEFLKKICVSPTELGFAGGEQGGIIFENLIVRGLAIWDEHKNGILVSRKGLDYGRMIDTLFRLKKVKIKQPELGRLSKYRDEKLAQKKLVFLGYELLYWAGISVTLLSLLWLGMNVYANLNLQISFPLWFKCIKYSLGIVAFIPTAFFVASIVLIKADR